MGIRELIQDKFDEAIEEDFGKAPKPPAKWRNVWKSGKFGKEFYGWGTWPSKDIAYTKAKEMGLTGKGATYIRTEKV
jgi:hypothetical protein